MKYFIALLLVCFFSSSFADTSSEQCKANVLPSYINNSMWWGFGQSVYQSLKGISPPSIFVTIAGNDHPEPVSPQKAKVSKDFNAIIVGSLTPGAKRSGFSQQGEQVYIMAPGNYPQTTSDQDGNLLSFSGTSGAAPLVTGSLAGFEWLSGYHPTPEEAKILLKNTAIPTRYSKDNPRTNGVGMVNAYKLGMVGKRLKEVCGQNQSCIKDRIQNPLLYKFDEDSGLQKILAQAFPECVSDACTADSSQGFCSAKEAVFKRLRKAVFLNPSNSELWRHLACIYRSSGFDENAKGAIEFYNNSIFPDGVAYCKTDEDCALVPENCGKKNRDSGDLKAMTKSEAAIYYIENPSCNKSLCNGKCRCEDEETVEISERQSETQVVYFKTFFSQCVKFRCVLSVTKARKETSEESVTEENSSLEESVTEENSSPSSGSR